MSRCKSKPKNLFVDRRNKKDWTWIDYALNNRDWISFLGSYYISRLLRKFIMVEFFMIGFMYKNLNWIVHKIEANQNSIDVLYNNWHEVLHFDKCTTWKEIQPFHLMCYQLDIFFFIFLILLCYSLKTWGTCKTMKYGLFC